ncbi:dynamin-1 [Trichonephila clavipes]|nr:dynamin-1 [Trichonephila clavipes]
MLFPVIFSKTGNYGQYVNWLHVIVCTGIDNACYVLSTLKGHRVQSRSHRVPPVWIATESSIYGEVIPLFPAVGPTKVWVATDSKGAAAELGNEQLYRRRRRFFERSKHLVKVLMQNESTQKKVHYLMLVMRKYMEIVQKQIADLTVKYILCFLVKKVLDYIKGDLVPTLLELSNFASLTDDCEEDFRLKEEMEAACRFIRILQWDIGEVVVEHICRFFIGASHQFCIVKNRLLRWFDASPGGLLRAFQDSLPKETDKMTSVDFYTLAYLDGKGALPEQDLTFDDYVLVDTDIAVWGALSDAEIVTLDHNNTESDEDESEELTPVTL